MNHATVLMDAMFEALPAIPILELKPPTRRMNASMRYQSKYKEWLNGLP